MSEMSATPLVGVLAEEGIILEKLGKCPKSRGLYTKRVIPRELNRVCRSFFLFKKKREGDKNGFISPPNISVISAFAGIAVANAGSVCGASYSPDRGEKGKRGGGWEKNGR